MPLSSSPSPNVEERDRHPPGNTDKPSSLTDHGSDSQTQRPQLKVVIPGQKGFVPRTVC